MQPLQRSYAISHERIKAMIQKGALSGVYDEAKVIELENAGELSGKDVKKLDALRDGKDLYDSIISLLYASVSEKKYMSISEFMPVITSVLKEVTNEKKLIDKIADGLSKMDKTATVQKDRKGNVIFDKETKDTEVVNLQEAIEDYMAREVWPHIPDAEAFFEEDLSKKKPVIKTGAEIPFTRFFYKYQELLPSDELEQKFLDLEKLISERVKKLFE